MSEKSAAPQRDSLVGGENGPLERFAPAGACLPAANSLCSGEERVYHVAAGGPNRKFRFIRLNQQLLLR